MPSCHRRMYIHPLIDYLDFCHVFYHHRCSCTGPTAAPSINYQCVSAGDTAVLTCPSGMGVASIVFASYGNAIGGCSSPSISSCHAASSQSVVEASCLGLSTCRIPSANYVFDGGVDPCYGTPKWLTVKATCTSAALVLRPYDFCILNAGEGSSQTITCPSNLYISAISFASYGKPYGTCERSVAPAYCNAASTMSTVVAACVGRQSCVVAADYRVHGDPCYGNVKSMTVIGTCAGIDHCLML